ncbi:hypothetical protein OEW28_12660 [Defluviimonas sp. WL0002]|uniref:Glycosyltransferase RgtA/B/C/D-like domain-containing protein n=1 Tax=Albidovulum marisflavi TaxID=2984159 RepID=A0ABT2ZEK3_9RHOB|nr:hypothetical protein [Defluviimonas sp. WL0002]MCV2869478.1 hypothetical protein [Defluviimonas sp. WL0002]
MKTPATRLPAICALSAAGGFLLLQVLSYLRAGVFEYPLDDVYIHLAMAKGIMGGTYGINPGEPASAASSVLYPLLLLPFPGTGFQRMLPLAWNFVGLMALAWLFGAHIARSGVSRGVALFLALIAPFALNMPGVAALGMEHTLHALMVMVLLTGFWRFLRTGEMGAALVAGAVLSPLFRFEGLALSLAVAGVLVLKGRMRAGIGLGMAVILPVALFALFLVSQGLEPLPSSVLAKIGGRYGGFDPFFRLAANVLGYGGAAALAAYVLVTIALLHPATRSDERISMFVLPVWAAATAHMLIGQVGWSARYEHYYLVMIGAALVLALPPLGTLLRGAVLCAALAAAGYYTFVNVTVYNWTARAIHLQQRQMARLAELLPGVPVAVNDIGWMSWDRRGHILDLWGLASSEARQARTAGAGGRPEPEWAARLVENASARYAMIYDGWIEEGIGAQWRLVATLGMHNPRGSLTAYGVSIYATDPDFEPELREAVRKLARDLPKDAELTEVSANE